MKEHLRSAAESLLGLVLVVALLFGMMSIWEPVRVAGRSMSPALRPGDVAIVRRHARPRDGTIVLIRAAGHGPVLHRVVAVGHDGRVTTRGDANSVDDRERVSVREVAGVVVRIVPAGELLRRWRGSE
jgi:signal peptidase I